MTADDHQLRDEIVRLGPWHLDVQVTPDLSTRVALDAPLDTYPSSFGQISFISPRESFQALLKSIYPDGLQQRSVLDCGCNCGAYLFWARELGAGDCFGFDARQHWINQARFLARQRQEPSSEIRFEVCDLNDLASVGLSQFDITLFHGLFYHLPDPVFGLKQAADLTREIVIINTATRNDLPDGVLALSREGTDELLSGRHGLNWFPSGPGVMTEIVQWLGFPETRCLSWQRDVPFQPQELGRLELVAARNLRILVDYDLAQAREYSPKF